jgi:3-oxoacyl-[acyl-carrier-protein] synthase II
MVTPLGVGTYESWSALAAGGSGVAWANLLGEQSALRHPAALVPEFPIQRYVTNRKLLRLMGRSDRFALAAAQMAISEAPPDGIHPERRGAFTATRKEIVPIESLFDVVRGSWDDTRTMDSVRLGRDGFGLIPPLTLVLGLPNGCLFALSVLHTVHGANTNFLGSGEVGLAAVAAAYQAVREGSVDWAVAGGHDSGADRWAYADFHRLGLLCQPSGDPARSVRPLDRRRSGFALGEGAAMVVVEDLEGARVRGARVRAEIVACAATSDAHGLVSPLADGTALATAVENALQQARLSPEDVDYVNAYASATPAGDRTELRALEAVFGRAPRRPLLGGIKGAIGHLLAASGAVEFAATALAVQHQMAPPTRNLEEPDPECHFDCLPGKARVVPIVHALTISRGIGGQNIVVVLRRCEP